MKKLIVSLLAMAALASCETAEEKSLPEPTPDNNLVSIELSAKVYGMEATTKAEMTNTLSGKTIGLYGVKEGTTTNKYEWTATPYFNNSGTVTVEAENVISFTEKLYYPQDNKKVKLFAFYPKETVTGPGAGTAPTVTYTIDGTQDILYGTATSVALKDKAADTKVDLTLNHKLAKLDFKVVAGTGFETGHKITKIVVTNTHTSLILNLDDGSLTPTGNAADIKAYTHATGTEITTTTSALLGTVLVEAGVSYGLTVSIDGDDTNTYTVTGLTSPNIAHYQTVTLTFKGTEIAATAKSGEWTPDTPDNADVQK